MIEAVFAPPHPNPFKSLLDRNCPGITKLERFLYCKAHLPQA